MRSLFLFFLLAYANISYSQDTSLVVKDTATYVAPEYIGGEDAMFQYIEKELQLSLSHLVAINEMGDNFSIRFKVDKFGDVIDINISSSSNPSINSYLVGIFASMPQWIPGTIKGEKASLQMVYKIRVQRGLDGYGYYVTKNDHTPSNMKSNNKLKTALGIVCIGLLVYLFVK